MVSYLPETPMKQVKKQKSEKSDAEKTAAKREAYIKDKLKGRKGSWAKQANK